MGKWRSTLTMVAVTKADVGEVALDWLSALAWQVTHTLTLPPHNMQLNKP